jgi:hypothetical protein
MHERYLRGGQRLPATGRAGRHVVRGRKLQGRHVHARSGRRGRRQRGCVGRCWWCIGRWRRRVGGRYIDRWRRGDACGRVVRRGSLGGCERVRFRRTSRLGRAGCWKSVRSRPRRLCVCCPANGESPPRGVAWALRARGALIAPIEVSQWDQHANHVTEVREDGRIPTPMQKSWQRMNTFRANARIEARATVGRSPRSDARPAVFRHCRSTSPAAALVRPGS